MLARLRDTLWIPLAALALAWALSRTPLYQRLDLLAFDAQMRLAAHEQYFKDALVIDIDDTSLRVMTPLLGSWPYARDTYAVLLDYLGEMGAQTVVFDILLADPRNGDARLRDAIARNPNIVLAATASPVAPEEPQAPAAPNKLGWPAPAALPGVPWPALQLPLADFTPPGRVHVGVVSVRADSDGLLRRIPLFHRVDGSVLPALPLAAHFANQAPPPVRLDTRDMIQVGDFFWPIDHRGALHLFYPRNVNSVLSIPFHHVAQAMLGVPGRELKPELIKGKTVFVGSSAFLSDRVLTPLGEMNGLYILAVTHQIMAHGGLLKPRHSGWSSLLLLIAVLPSLLLAWRPRRAALTGAALMAGAACVVYLAHLALLGGLRQESSLLYPLLVLVFANLFETARALRWMNQEQQAQIQLLAHDDPLTHLPNRATLHAHLAHAIEVARMAETGLAVLLIDLDHFKNINDSLGHEVGDRMLVEATARLRASVRAGDTIARLGGDEFGIILSAVEDASAEQWAEKILNALAPPYQLAGQDLHVTSCIGISLYPADGADAATLLKHADAAMYRAKAQGRNRYQRFTPELSQAAMARFLIENQLRQALDRDEFVLFYQPQIDLHTGSMVGVEALVRWNHPTYGLLAPDDFIPVAEDSGLILPLGKWVLRHACRQLQVWRAAGLTHIERVAVNLSARQFEEPGLPALVADILREVHLDAARLELEITESVAMKNPQRSIAILDALRKMGITLALDDFGTGHSSLTYLKLFPITCLKIDQSFVRDIETDKHDAEICGATIALARKLGLKVVAEGIETAGQLLFLRNIECGEAQGYLFSPPMPAESMARFEPARASATARMAP